LKDVMESEIYQPVIEVTRGLAGGGAQTVESIHFGAIAVVNVNGKILAWYGDPYAVTYLRSTAKPLQAMPFYECGGREAYDLSLEEVALTCASHSGTDDHVRVAESLQKKAGLHESDLLCGTHPPMHEATAKALLARGEKPTSNRHNCSGKHSGMLAYAKMSGLPLENYIDPAHPIQKTILATFAEMCRLPVDQVRVGTDGCSAPNFAVPLYNAALAYARLCDPLAGEVHPPQRAAACKLIFSAMTNYPQMIGGPGRFDTALMQVAQGRLVCKEGAEGYQGIGLPPGALGAGSPATGIAIKVSDGDARDRAIHAVALEVLRQLGALDQSELEALSTFGPKTNVLNWRKLVVGEVRPCFELIRE
jgi:L-asparaginase II